MLVLLLTLAQLGDGQVVETQQPATTVIEQANTWAAMNLDNFDGSVPQTGNTFITHAWVSWPCRGLGCMVQSEWKLHFTLRVDAKDGRFRVQILNPELAWPPSRNSASYRGVIRQKGDKKAAAEALAAIAADLIASIQDTSDDW